MRISDWSSDVCSSDLAGVSNTAWPNNILVSGGESFSITGRLTHDFGWATLTSVTNYSENDFQEGLEGGRGTPSVTLATVKPDTFVQQIGRASCRERVCQYV